MKGCRPLTPEEIEAIKEYFLKRDDPLAVRDYTMFFFALYSGFRIAELLSVKVKDVYSFGVVSDSVYLRRCNTKKKVEGRNGIINEHCKEILKKYLSEYGLIERMKIIPEVYLFPSPRDGRAIKTRQAHNIFKNAYVACELQGKLACHTTRKTFADRAYDSLERNIVDLQTCMGHRNISSTAQYISSDNKKVLSVLKKLQF